MGMGSVYESKLVESLGAIDQKSKSLMEEATKSHIFEFHMCKYVPVTESNRADPSIKTHKRRGNLRRRCSINSKIWEINNRS